MPLAYAEMILKGDPGTTVEISLFKSRRPDPQKVTIDAGRRSLILRVRSEMMADQIGYIRPETLVDGKVKEVAAAVKSLQQQGAKRIVLDLRNCAVGDPNEGAALANLFMDQGLMTYLQGQKIPRQDFKADPAKADHQAAAAGDCQSRHGRSGRDRGGRAARRQARSIGGRATYGDAAMRSAVTMDDGGAIILSVAKYYSPSGKAIQDVGVTPQTLLAEPEAQVELDDDGNPVAPENDNAPKKDPGHGPDYLKRVLRATGSRPAAYRVFK